MALLQLSFPSLFCRFNSRSPQRLPTHSRLCVSSCLSNETTVAGATMASGNTVVRRSANYQPPIWNHEFWLSLKSEFSEETYKKRMKELKKAVKVMVEKKMAGEDSLEQLELIDTLQRLGLSYHFEEDINQILTHLNHRFHKRDNKTWKKKNNLYATALEFRILRQHGYSIPQDVLIGFKDEIEDVSACVSEEKAKGMLSLYEASFLSVEGENFLDEARDFTLKYLEKYMKLYSSNNEAHIVSSMVNHALELPLHWRMPRLEARWFIDIYQRRPDMDPILFEFAKLDFNILQSIHQQELKDVSSWWRRLGVGENLSFSRDRLISNYLLALGVGFQPHLGDCRRLITKINLLLTALDDVYDIYGTLDELQLFNDAINRWEVDATDQLPEYMKIFFLAIHNTTNDMAFDIFKAHQVNVVQYLKKMWSDVCKTYLTEATWYHTKHRPTFQEYFENAWISMAAPFILVNAYIFGIRPLEKEVLESVKDYPDIVRYSSMIFRLVNDLSTSSNEMKRGDVLKSLECYINDTGASEGEARKYIRSVMDETWKKMNKEVGNPSKLCLGYREMCVNLGRTCCTMYHNGDGFTSEDDESKIRALSLFIQHI